MTTILMKSNGDLKSMSNYRKCCNILFFMITFVGISIPSVGHANQSLKAGIGKTNKLLPIYKIKNKAGIGKADKILPAHKIKQYAIKGIDKSKVAETALALPGLIDSHKKIKHIGIAIMTLGTLTQLTYLVCQLTAASSDTPEEKKESVAFWRRILNGLYSFGSGLIDPHAWLSFLYASGKIGVQIGGHAVMHHLVNAQIQKVSHEDTLSWYKKSQTSFDSLEKELLSDVTAIIQGDIEHKEVVYRKSAFIDLAQSLVYQVEKIAGYIQYKGLQNRALYQKPADKAVNYLIETTNQFVRECNQSLDTGVWSEIAASAVVVDVTKLTKAIEDFYKKSKKIIHDFARLDVLDEVNAPVLEKSKKECAQKVDAVKVGAVGVDAVGVDVDTKIEN